jgi:Mn2+/Fe2+ NRAMP family transporter
MHHLSIHFSRLTSDPTVPKLCIVLYVELNLRLFKVGLVAAGWSSAFGSSLSSELVVSHDENVTKLIIAISKHMLS